MGSEMCIRDRRRAGARAEEGGARRLRRAGSHASPDGGEPEEKGCLLYTSDAADERSSVDIGGRRIIKQKK